MILELADIVVKPGTGPDFEVALTKAKTFVAQTPGFLSLGLRRGIESTDRYVLLIEWESVSDHLEGFRESSAFASWRELIGPFFASPPNVEHFDLVDVSS